MRPLRLAALLLAGCVGVLCAMPQSSEACGRRARAAAVYGPAYYAPGPAAYAPPMYYAPGPAYAQPYPAPLSGPPAAAAVTVAMYDDNFQPAALNVQPGTTVRWVNYGKHAHTVTSKDGRWDSGDIPPGGSYAGTFVHPGTYYYHCRHHKGMEGSVTVGAAAPGGGYGGSGSGY